MISKIFLCTNTPELLVDKDYRQDTGSKCISLFLNKIKTSKNSHLQPHFIQDGHTFYNIYRNGVYFVATSYTEISSVFVIELLSRLYHIFKDFCGVVNEHSIKANLLLIYEILDEFLNEGYVQLASTDKLQPYIQSEPVIVTKKRSPANELSSRVFGIETKMLPGSAADTPVVQSSSDTDINKNELFVDVIEKMVAVMNSDGSVSRMEVHGSINMKNFLLGSPEIKVFLNEDLVVAGDGMKSYGNQVQLDRCVFHKSVTPTDASSCRELVLAPPVGEFAAMSYNVNGEDSLIKPFRLQAFVGDQEGSSGDRMLTLRLHCDIPPQLLAPSVTVCVPVPDIISSVSTVLGAGHQSSEFREKEKMIVWVIKKMPGKTEAVAQFRLNCYGSGKFGRSDIGPATVDFEISGFTSSGLRIQGLKIQGSDKAKQRQHWVRHLTISESVVFRL